MKHRKIRVDHTDGLRFGNPRQMRPRMKEVLSNTIAELGFAKPIIVRDVGEGRYEVIDGHHRLEYALEHGLKTIDAMVIDVPDDVKAKALALALNRVSADWVSEDLDAFVDGLLKDLDTVGAATWVADVTGFSGEEVEALLASNTDFLAGLTDGDGGEDDGADPLLPDAMTQLTNFSVYISEEQQASINGAIALAKKVGAKTAAEALKLICDAYSRGKE